MEYEFIGEGITLREAKVKMLAIIEDWDLPSSIVPLSNLGDPELLSYYIKCPKTDSGTKFDELHKGLLEITVIQAPDGIQLDFTINKFPKKVLFAETMKRIIQDMGVEQTTKETVNQSGLSKILTNGPIINLSGEIVKVTYGDKTNEYKISKGFEYLSYLVSNPYKDISALDLRNIKNPSNLGEYNPELSSRFDPKQRKIDRQAARQCRDAILEIDTRLKFDIEEHYLSDEEKEKLLRDKKFYENYLEKSEGRFGRSRNFIDDNERARSSISKDINHAISKLADNTPELAKLLNSAIEKGNVFCYSPKIPKD